MPILIIILLLPNILSAANNYSVKKNCCEIYKSVPKINDLMKIFKINILNMSVSNDLTPTVNCENITLKSLFTEDKKSALRREDFIKQLYLIGNLKKN